MNSILKKFRSNEAYFAQAEKILFEHKCSTMMSLECSLNELSIIDLEEDNKENCRKKSRKRHSSPTNGFIILDEQKNEILKIKTPKKRKLKSPKSPLTPLTKNNDICPSSCDCAEFKILQFQINFYKFLCVYFKIRCKQLEQMSELVESRLKETTVILTNSDSLQLQTITTERLLCPQFINEANSSDNDDLIELLEPCFKILETIAQKGANDQELWIVEMVTGDKTSQRQFFELIDLLANIFGLFGYLDKRLKTFEYKYKILKFIQKNEGIVSSMKIFEPIFIETCIDLMRFNINLHKCDQFEILLSRIFSVPIPQEAPKAAETDSITDISCQKKSASSTTKSTTNDSYVDKVVAAFENDKLFSAKPDTLVTLYMIFTHYLVLKHRVS